MTGTGLPVAVATGIGSLPGTDPDEACRIVAGELPDLPHLPELPDRGVGADMIGRAGGLLVDLGVDLQPSGWRLVSGRTTEGTRAREFLERDLAALQVALYGYTGPLKVQVTGPLTLAAALERARGGLALADEGARRDLVASLAEGVAAHVAEVRRRVPGASVVLQLDEPSLPAVLAGRIRTPSGFATYRPVEAAEATDALREVLASGRGSGPGAGPGSGRGPGPASGAGSAGGAGDGRSGVVHCCARDVPVAVIDSAGAAAVSFDLSVAGAASMGAYEAAVDAGLALWVGAVPAGPTPAAAPEPGAVLDRVLRWWRDLGYDEEGAAARTVLTPACGLAGATPAQARRAYEAVRAAAARLRDAGRDRRTGEAG